MDMDEWKKLTDKRDLTPAEADEFEGVLAKHMTASREPGEIPDHNDRCPDCGRYYCVCEGDSDF